MPNAAKLTFHDIAVGQTVSFNVVITPELVQEFAHVSGDQSPLHTDNTYAATTAYGARIAHGMLGGALFSQLIGMHLPGQYAVYLSQNLRFKHPIMIGASLTVRGTVTHKTGAMKTVSIQTELIDTNNVVLTDGTALVQLLA